MNTDLTEQKKGDLGARVSVATKGSIQVVYSLQSTQFAFAKPLSVFLVSHTRTHSPIKQPARRVPSRNAVDGRRAHWLR